MIDFEPRELPYVSNIKTHFLIEKDNIYWNKRSWLSYYIFMREFFLPLGLFPWILVLHFLYMQDLIIWYKIGREEPIYLPVKKL